MAAWAQVDGYMVMARQADGDRAMAKGYLLQAKVGVGVDGDRAKVSGGL